LAPIAFGSDRCVNRARRRIKNTAGSASPDRTASGPSMEVHLTVPPPPSARAPPPAPRRAGIRAPPNALEITQRRANRSILQ
jgi:hypothetical protein